MSNFLRKIRRKIFMFGEILNESEGKMDDFKKYAPQIALLKEFFWDFWLMDLTDADALEIIKTAESRAKRR